MGSHQHETNLQPKSHHSQAETENLQPDVLSNIAPPLAHPAMVQPSPANPQTILQLQRQYGNRYVNRVLQQSQSSRSMPIQAKMTIGAAGDKYEQEADCVAKQVVNQINAPTAQSPNSNQTVQREAMTDEDDELRMKPQIGTLQREEIPEEEDNDNELMMKPLIQRKASAGEGAVATETESAINQAKGSGKPLDKNIRQSMEKAFGKDFSNVKVHTDAQSNELNQSIQARAFTTGKDIFFRQGEYNPVNISGQELIAHELTHVLQQSHTSVKQANLKRTNESPKVTSLSSANKILLCKKYKALGMLKTGGFIKDATSRVPVPYMDATTRQQYRIDVNNGMLYKQDGTPLDTSNELYIFVMDIHGNIFAANKSNVVHHSAFLAGRPVAAAGRIKVRDGILQFIDNQSGHYQPSRDYMKQFLKELKKRRINLKQVQMNLGRSKKHYKKVMKKFGARERLYTPKPPKKVYY